MNYQMYIAPAVCLVFGVFGIFDIIRVLRKWGSIKMKSLIMGIVGIPSFVALMLQMYGVVNHPELAKILGSDYMESQQLDDTAE